MDGRSNVGRPCGNGRDGGGTAGTEQRYKFPAVDVARNTEAKASMTPRGKWQGESGKATGSDLNTMDGPPRGTIMGNVLNPSWPEGGFPK